MAIFHGRGSMFAWIGALVILQISLISNPKASPLPTSTLDASKVCQTNAALGDKANPAITELCKSVSTSTEKSKRRCKSIPPDRISVPNQSKLSLGSLLSNGISEMNTEMARDSNQVSRKKAIFLLGFTGSGKTTVTQMLAGNMNKLYATTGEKGNLVIVDEGSRIGLETTQSRTLIPKYVVNPETGAAFWDTVGFLDSHDEPEIDIASMYFTKHALDSTSSAKFLFLVPHSQVKNGSRTADFDKLTTNAIGIFANVTKFRDAVGLVVTKVGGASYSNMTEGQILDSIKKFLETDVNAKKNQLKAETEEMKKNELKNKIEFVQGIIGQGKRPRKFYFVRTPEHCGSLGEMAWAKNGVQKLTDMINKNMKYTSVVTPKNFKLSLKPAALRVVERDVMPKTIQKIKRSISQIKPEIDADFRGKLSRKLEDSLENGIRLLRNITSFMKDNLGNYTSVDSATCPKPVLGQQLLKLYSELGFKTKCSKFAQLQALESQLNFFELVTSQAKSGATLDPSRMNFIRDFAKTLEDLQKFYEFCKETEPKLKEYSTQVKLATLLKSSRVEESRVLNLLENTGIIEPTSNLRSLWSNVKSDDKKYLANMIQQYVPKLETKCVKSTVDNNLQHLIITGRNLKMSDVANTDQWPQDCKLSTVKELSVVAMEKVFVDRAMNFQGLKLHLSIIATMLEVVDNGTGASLEINLDGVSTAYNPPKAANAADYGRHGTNGVPGISGGDAGSFFGVFSEIKNAHLLSIRANGGNGGRGQDGGDGFLGKSGADASDDKFRDKGAVSCNNGRGEVSGENAQNGGNGGNGGTGGSPGHPGIIQIIPLSNISPNATLPIRTSVNFGAAGTPGNGGQGAPGGRKGFGRVCECRPAVGVGWGGPSGDYSFFSCDVARNSISAPRGSPGKTGQTASNPPAPPSPKKWKVINEYKAAFFGNSSTLSFLKELDSNSEVRRLTGTIAFAEEAEAIGKAWYTTSLKGNRKLEEFISTYERFITRLTDHVNSSLSKNELTTQDRIAFNSIYAAILGQFIGLQRNENTLNVINTEGYFNALAMRLETLQTAQKEVVIRSETDKFRDTLDGKAREAMGFIQNTVLPAIEDAEAGLERMNDKLLNELNDFLKEAEKDVERKKNMTRKFEKAMGLKQLMGVLNVFGSALSFLGPVGTAVGAGISATTSIASSMVSAPDSSSMSPAKEIKVPTALTNRMGEVNKEFLQTKLGGIEKQIDLTLEAVEEAKEEDPEEGEKMKVLEEFANGVKTSLEGLKDYMENKDGDDADPVKAISLEADLDKKLNKLKAEVTKKEEEVAKKGEPTKEDTKGKAASADKSAKIVENLSAGIKTVEAVGSLMQNIAADESELQKMKEMTKAAMETVKALEKKKDQFYNELLPGLESIQQGIKSETSELPGQSQVALSVKKWKVKGMLKSMRWFIQQFTKEFQVTEEFQVCFDTLDEALTLQIDLYDHIERYEEKKELADFIANVNSASGSKSQITDRDLRAVLERLDFSMQGNLFLEEYQKGIHAFKQWVFPFANRYLGDKNDVLGVPANFAEMVEMYKKKVKDLRTEMAVYKSTTNNGDVATIVNTFRGDIASSRPFYVWSNDQWQGSIKKLLSGQAVELKADVDMIGQEMHAQKFFNGKAAIKYKVVELTLRAKDQKRQNELDERLKHFQMIMIHSGISLYKVLGEHYVMFDSNQTYRYSFERINNEHVSANGVKYKVEGQTADFLMSPYTWWTFRLIDATAGSGHDFIDLEEFEEVDLQLDGKGVYLDENSAPPAIMKNLNLADHYELYDSKSDANMETGMCIA